MDSIYFECVVPGCESNMKDDHPQSFFCLPKDLEMLEKWGSNMNILDVVQKPLSTRLHYRMCGIHFEDSCFQTPAKTKLNRKVIPTILKVEPEFHPHQLSEMCICENHFDESCFINETHQRLRINAVPFHFQRDLRVKDEDPTEKAMVMTPSPPDDIKFVNFPQRTYQCKKDVAIKLDSSPPKKNQQEPETSGVPSYNTSKEHPAKPQDVTQEGNSLSKVPETESVFVKYISSHMKHLPKSVCNMLMQEIKYLVDSKRKSNSFSVGPVETSSDFEEVFVKSEIDIGDFVIQD